jgi:hypothetical protein
MPDGPTLTIFLDFWRINMTSLIVNSAEDLAALEGTVEYAEFLTLLEGSLWRVERDDAAQTFVAIEDNSTIERYGLTRADFPNAQPPELPEWTPPPSNVPQTVSPLQAKAELMARELYDDVVAVLNAAGDPVMTLAWETASEFRRTSPMVLGIAGAMSWNDGYLDDLFTKAAERSF